MGEKEIYAYRRAGGSQFLSSVWKLNGLRMIIGFLLMSLYGICQLVDEILVRHGWKRKPGSSSPQLILNEIVAGRIWQVQYGHNNSTIIKGKDGKIFIFQFKKQQTIFFRITFVVSNSTTIARAVVVASRG